MIQSAADVLALAPDPAAAKAGAALAAPRRWSALGGDGEGRAAWGECQGSGAQPYRTAVALADLATHCSCPSRKFPCKHALGLLLLLTAEPELFAVADPPAWVAEWLAGRTARAERRERAAAAPDDAGEEDAAAADRSRRAAARADRRATRATAGLAELARWLEDLVRGGIASAPSRPAAFWETTAARLVDAQLPGAARLVRQLGLTVTTGAAWPERFVAALGRLHLLVRAAARLEAVPADAQHDVRAALGWPPATGQGERVADAWIVVGQVTEVEDRLRARRTWLVGRETGRHALLLHFAHGETPFAEAVPAVGHVLAAELEFFSGTVPLRATACAHATGAPPVGAPNASPNDTPRPPGRARLADATAGWAAALARNPWTERVLLVLDAVVPEQHGDRWLLRDAAGDALPLAPRFRAEWPLAAVAGGRPAWVAGEWDGEALFPMAAAGTDGELVSLAQFWEPAR